MTASVPYLDKPRHGGSLVIVALAYGAGDEILALLQRLNLSGVAGSETVIIVHNPSQLGEKIEIPQAMEKNACLLELAANAGYVGGMNAGIQAALGSTPEYILLLTHDVRIGADEVRHLRSIMDDHTDLGVIGPVLFGPDAVPYSAGFVGNHRGIRHRRAGNKMPRPIWRCVGVDGSAMMWRVAALEQVTGFDERFFMYFEDIDICTRVARRGWGIAVASDVRAESSPGGGSRRSAHAYLRSRNGLAYARTFGRAGLVSGLLSYSVGLWHATPKPGGRRFHDKGERQRAAAYWHGTLLGVVDYFRGRWGAPPPSMLRGTDIGGT